MVELLESRVFLATYYVGTGGNDSSADPSNPATPWRTIQKATTMVNPGDTVIVQPGTYFGPITLTRTGTASQPITFKADAIAQNRVVITNANKNIRDKTLTWTLEDASKQLYSIPLGHYPARVLYDGVDLLPYKTLAELNAFKMGANLDYPGAKHGYTWVSSSQKLYVRLRTADTRYGSSNPNHHIMAVAPPAPLGGEGKGYDVGTSGTLYNFGITPQGAAHVILDGFSFETPGVAAVYVRGSDVTVRNSWFRGVKTGVAGRRFDPQDDPYRTDNITIEYCDYSQFPTYSDAEEIIHEFASTWFDVGRSGDWKFFWWQRKGQSDDKWLESLYDYESPGITSYMGQNWIIRNNHLWECFDGIGAYSMTNGVNGVKIYENFFHRIVDNAIEFENRGYNIEVHHNEILDVFMPLSWQPLGGTPWPTNIWVYKNLIHESDGFGSMWKNEGQYRGAWLKIGAAEKQWNWWEWMANVPKNPVDPGEQGLWFYNNTIVTPDADFLEDINSGFMNMLGTHFYNNVVVCEDWYGNWDLPSNYWTMTFSRNVRSSDMVMPNLTENRIAGGGGLSLRNPALMGFVDYSDGGGGNYALTSGSPARNLGVAVPNRPSSEWHTDAGAIPYGSSWVRPTIGPQALVGVPLTPTGLVAVAGNAQVALTWAAASGAASYNVKRSTTSGGPYSTIGSGITTTGYTNTGLTNGTTYYYVVSAVNGSGESSDSAQASAIPQVPGSVPSAPTGLSATAVSTTQINLSWTAPPGTVSGYNIYRATASGGQGATPVNPSPITGTTYVDSGLMAGTPYYYKVAAVNAVGTGPQSSEAAATTATSGGGTPGNLIDFDVSSDYSDNFREVGGYTGNIGWDGSGVIAMSHTQNWRSGVAIYDTTPSDGQTSVNAFGGSTAIEQYSLDFRIGTSGIVKLFARLSDPAVNGGYYLMADRTGSGRLALRIPTTAASPDNENDLAEASIGIAVGSWYTLQFTLQNNPANTAVILTGKLFPQGDTTGNPLATVSFLHSNSPTLAAGQTGFAATSGGASAPGATTNVDNFSIGIPDTTAPMLNTGSFDQSALPNALVMQFSENVGASLGIDDLTLQKVGATNTVIPSGYSYNASTHTATFSFANELPEGNYVATLSSAGVTDAAGNPLAPSNGVAFFVLPGDANGDRIVDTRDFNILAGSFGQSGRIFAQGNFDYIGVVDSIDFGILISQYGKKLSPPQSTLPVGSAAMFDLFSPMNVEEDEPWLLTVPE